MTKKPTWGYRRVFIYVALLLPILPILYQRPILTIISKKASLKLSNFDASTSKPANIPVEVPLQKQGGKRDDRFDNLEADMTEGKLEPVYDEVGLKDDGTLDKVAGDTMARDPELQGHVQDPAMKPAAKLDRMGDEKVEQPTTGQRTQILQPALPEKSNDKLDQSNTDGETGQKVEAAHKPDDSEENPQKPDEKGEKPVEEKPAKETETEQPTSPSNKEKTTTKTKELSVDKESEVEQQKAKSFSAEPMRPDEQSEQNGKNKESKPGEKFEPQPDDISIQLPPRLAPALKHLKRPADGSLKAPYEWKLPAMLTALGLPEGDKLKLVIFSTGVNLIGFKRSFHFIGCQVGNKTYPRFGDLQKTPHFCMVDPDISFGAHISILIRRDETVTTALEEPLIQGEFVINNTAKDFVELGKEVVIDDKVRELAEEYDIISIKSNVKWHEGMREKPFDPRKPRFELCLMTAMRQYPYMLQQWFDFYRQVGVDQIYVYDNVAYEDLSQFDSDFVQTAFWPFGRSQYQSFNHFMLLAKNRCKYIGFFDADEYVFVGGSGTEVMKRYVRKKMEDDGYDQILFPFIVMSGNGHVTRPEGFLPELYPRRNLRQSKFHVGKTVIDTDMKWVRHMVHFASGGRNWYQNYTFELNPTTISHNGMLVHYTRRSFEELIMKHKTGGASVVTNARPPLNMSIESVPKYYLSNDSTVEFLEFRDRWRAIMKEPVGRDVALLWKSGNRTCRTGYCLKCNGTEFGDVSCSTNA